MNFLYKDSAQKTFLPDKFRLLSSFNLHFQPLTIAENFKKSSKYLH